RARAGTQCKAMIAGIRSNSGSFKISLAQPQDAAGEDLRQCLDRIIRVVEAVAGVANHAAPPLTIRMASERRMRVLRPIFTRVKSPQANRSKVFRLLKCRSVEASATVSNRSSALGTS